MRQVRSPALRRMAPLVLENPGGKRQGVCCYYSHKACSMAVKFQDYYETLGVERQASQDEIKRAYRKLARKYHPDVNKEASAKGMFEKINEAYEVLGDPDKRKKYDQLGANWKHGQDLAAGGHGFEDGGFSYSTGGGHGGEFSGDFSDFFNQFFAGAGAGRDRTAGRRRGRSTSFEDLFGGSAGGMGGMGAGPSGAGPSGAGRAGAVQTPMQEAEATVSLYEAHHGTTRQLSLQGPQGTQTLDVKIPAGVTEGSKIRLRAKGVQIKVRVAGDPRFQVTGHDLTTDVKIDPATAALGGKVDVETLEGPATLTIPEGTSSGGKLRLKGKGLHKRGQDERGDLFARVMITVPKSLTDEQREAYEKLREAG